SIKRKLDEPFDTTRDNRYWWRALKHGKIYFNDSTVHYPGLVKLVYNSIQWKNRNLDSYDSTYVTGTGRPFKINIKNNNWIDIYNCHPLPKAQFTFYSGVSSTIGLQFSAYGLTLGYSSDIDKLIGKRPTSKKWEFGFSCARFSIDFYKMRNSGAMNLDLRDEETGQLYKIPHFTGIKRSSWGISSYYYFNNRKFSQGAAYSQSRLQRRSAGSFLAGFKITHHNLEIDASELGEIWKDIISDDNEDLSNEPLFKYNDYSIGGGYAYNWVLGPKWLLNGTVMIFPGIKHAHAISTLDDGGQNFFGLNGKLRLAATYSHRSFFASFQGYLDSHVFNTGIYRFQSFLADVSIIVGARF
ncbi:MAG: DUF4421 domain-containing protein, partial [Muribaculaceae bacterium]|nr:DUF4421 domain-containing protein [Muribaculaceae bacterium]